MRKGLSISKIQSAMQQRRKEWIHESVPQKATLSYYGNQLAGEVGELCNDIKKLERLRLGFVGGKNTRDNIPKEMADVIMCVALLANEMGIDLDTAVAEKFNETSEKHGMDTRIAYNLDEGYHATEIRELPSPAETELY